MNGPSKTSEYVYLAYLTEPREVGESTKRSPQHLTLVPPFPFDTPLPMIKEAVDEVAAEAKPIQAVVDKEARFGATRNIIVRLIKPAGVIRALHFQLMYSLQSRGVTVPSKFVYETYLPHVTIKPVHQAGLAKNQRLTINHIAIMHKDKGHRTMLYKKELN